MIRCERVGCVYGCTEECEFVIHRAGNGCGCDVQRASDVDAANGVECIRRLVSLCKRYFSDTSKAVDVDNAHDSGVLDLRQSFTRLVATDQGPAIRVHWVAEGYRIVQKSALAEVVEHRIRHAQNERDKVEADVVDVHGQSVRVPSNGLAENITGQVSNGSHPSAFNDGVQIFVAEDRRHTQAHGLDIRG